MIKGPIPKPMVHLSVGSGVFEATTGQFENDNSRVSSPQYDI